MNKNTNTLSRNCDHTRLNSRWINDGYGIPLARVCDKCEDAQLARFRPDIMSRYDHDEPLDEEWSAFPKAVESIEGAAREGHDPLALMRFDGWN